ncbi:MAG: helix-turn-helix domain-containing protein [Planctomycetes bacterium]|nr:helix-turn-helix domain-containing protein [Planctomycetota bacterium]
MVATIDAALERAGGSRFELARVAGVSPSAIAYWHRGKKRPRGESMRRLTAAAQGDDPDEREARLRLYEERFAAGLGIFSGEPAEDAVSPAQLAAEAEAEELAKALGGWLPGRGSGRRSDTPKHKCLEVPWVPVSVRNESLVIGSGRSRINGPPLRPITIPTQNRPNQEAGGVPIAIGVGVDCQENLK